MQAPSSHNLKLAFGMISQQGTIKLEETETEGEEAEAMAGPGVADMGEEDRMYTEDPRLEQDRGARACPVLGRVSEPVSYTHLTLPTKA